MHAISDKFGIVQYIFVGNKIHKLFLINRGLTIPAEIKIQFIGIIFLLCALHGSPMSCMC